MKHLKGRTKLNRTTKHRESMARNMVTSVLEHTAIETTIAKAKFVKPLVDKMITLAKKGDVYSRRRAARIVKNPDVLKNLFDNMGEKYKDRNGGYTRVLRTRIRQGDNATMARLELV